MKGFKIVRLRGVDYLFKSSLKKPLRSPIMHNGKAFKRIPKPRKIHNVPLVLTREIKSITRTVARGGPTPGPGRVHHRVINRPVHRTSMTGIEIEALKKVADRAGVPRDMVDWEAHIDKRLSFSENRAQIEQTIRGNNHEMAHKHSFEVDAGHAGIDPRIDDHVELLEWKVAAGQNHTIKQELAGWKSQRIGIKEGIKEE